VVDSLLDFTALHKALVVAEECELEVDVPFPMGPTNNSSRDTIPCNLADREAEEEEGPSFDSWFLFTFFRRSISLKQGEELALLSDTLQQTTKSSFFWMISRPIALPILFFFDSNRASAKITKRQDSG
jgi:hypothetical protein